MYESLEKEMELLTRKVFYNKKNNQASVTLPAKVLKDLQEKMKLKVPPKKISFELLTPSEKLDLKKTWQTSQR